jgi:diguanylate cyclase (GGDEF)-like protein
MAKENTSHQFTETSQLEAGEALEIKQQVDFELIDKQYQLLKTGILVNLVGSIIVMSAFYSHIQTSVLFIWFLALVVVDTCGMSNIYLYSKNKPTYQRIKSWQWRYRASMVAICLVWGYIGVLFFSNDVQYQFYLVFTLFILIVCIGLGNILDFISAAASIVCLLIPYMIFSFYTVFSSVFSHGLNLQFSISVLVLGIFLVFASYIGFRLIKRAATLGLVNAALSKKLESMNKILEQRVQERTAELEVSLKKATYLATHDTLTGLPNRRLLLDHMETAIKTANKNQQLFAVLFFSLNKIEQINDALGHVIGELVIQTIATRLKAIVEQTLSSQFGHMQCSVFLARSDEFILLFQAFDKIEEIEKAATVLFSVLDEPIHTKQQTIKLTASIGISIYPQDGRDSKLLLMNADAAKLRGKEVGGNKLNIYKPEINADISKQLEMESDLHIAVKNNEFVLQYQPFIDLKNKKVCGMEALVRWQHPVLGFISPALFIQLAEANGLIVPLGLWILRTACMQLKAWHEQGFTSLKIAVNLSAKQLQQNSIVEDVANVLKETNLKAKYLELELTETEAFKDEVIPILKQFTAMGVSLSIDDFGTGFSGLTNLKRLRISKLKIDQSFVQDIPVANHF